MTVDLRLALLEERADVLAERIGRLLGPFSGTEVALDSGCGVGALAFALAPRVGEVVGVDVNPDYLEAGRAIAPENVRFQEGEATALPFGYASFDIAGCLRLLHHVRRPELAVAELARVARPGGRVFVADQLGSVDPLRSLEQDRFERLRDPSHQRLLSEADIRGSLDANDLVLVTSEVSREEVDLEQRLELGGRSGGGPDAHPRPRAGRGLRDRGRLVRGAEVRAVAGSAARSVLGARPVAVAADEPGDDAGEERLEDRDRAVREPRNRDLPLPFLHHRDERLRDVVGVDHEAPHEPAREVRARSEALGLDEAGQERVHLDPFAGAASPASEREKASCACFAAAVRPAGANAIVPETETTLTTCALRVRPPLEPGQERAGAPDAAEVVRRAAPARSSPAEVDAKLPGRACRRC